MRRWPKPPGPSCIGVPLIEPLPSTVQIGLVDPKMRGLPTEASHLIDEAIFVDSVNSVGESKSKRVAAEALPPTHPCIRR